MIIIVTVYATDISIIKEIKGDVKNQPYVFFCALVVFFCFSNEPYFSQIK